MHSARFHFIKKLQRNVTLQLDTRDSNRKVIKKFASYNKMLEAYNKSILISSNYNKKKPENVFIQHSCSLNFREKYITYSYIPGIDLFDYLCWHVKSDKIIPYMDTMQTISDQIQWLQSEKLVHLDMKLENIIINKVENRMYLIDFDSLHNLREPSMPEMRTFGTQSYLSPEVMFGHYIHKNTDLWSMGIMGFMLCAQYHPYQCSHVNIENVQEYSWHILKEKNKDYAEKIYYLLHRDPDLRKNMFVHKK